MRSFVELENVDFAYGSLPVLERINLTVEPGDVLGIIGPNGSGKTTLLRIMLGLLPPLRGAVRLFGHPPGSFRQWGRLGYVPQKAALDRGLPVTVREVVATGLLPSLGVFGRSGGAARRRLRAVLRHQAMQEPRVTVQGRSYTLPEPCFVFATRNPIELEGTYALPEAQLDRFAFEIVLEYLQEEQELDVVRSTTTAEAARLEPVLGAERLLAYQRLVRRVPIADAVSGYALALVRATRPGTGQAAELADRWLAYGASVRAGQFLVLAGKARALMRGRVHVGFEDVRALAHPVLRHRLLRNFHAEAERITVEGLIGELLDTVPVPREAS